jgi:CRP-like cAMP-binding protein
MGDGILERYTGSYPKGTVLFEEGQPGDRMFVIRSGKVQIAKQVGSDQIVIAVLGPGESVGEMAILDGQPRSATATVLEDAVLVELDGATFETLIHESGEIAVRIMRKLSQRLRDANRQIESFLDHNGALCAIRLLRGLAGAERDGWRPLPAGTGPTTIATCTGMPPGEAQGIWERLRAIGLVADQPGPRLASEPRLDEYLAYLDNPCWWGLKLMPAKPRLSDKPNTEVQVNTEVKVKGGEAQIKEEVKEEQAAPTVPPSERKPIDLPPPPDGK